ncbi:TPA: glycogen synthase GlgA [Candidatus Edwardsbacteria bacterium]|nr:glycogen synthase GlgA [Candidatus Edwardsbacteria bacterium]HBZ86551.1 glycogen synthase GlgA [Candidatus Edwardsbacteria bacterium]
MTERPLNIITIASEMVPFAKTGGLADVAGSLAQMYQQAGHRSIAIVPHYQASDKNILQAESTGIEFEVPIGHGTEKITVFRSRAVPGVTSYLIDHPYFNSRAGLYGTAQGDYQDNAQRFILFARASLELIIRLGVNFDIVHCHDWQCGLIPVYLKNIYYNDPVIKDTKTVFTIHNLAFQGLFPPETMLAAGLPWSLFHIDGLEFYGKMNFLKGGLSFSDHITTVSPNYAREILTPEFGCGLHGLLNILQHKLSGIINGIDYSEWDPGTDRFLPARYYATDFTSKQTSKRLLCRRFGLKYQAEKPLLGMVSRLSAQKGLDILVECLPRLFESNLDIAILGTGDIGYHELLISRQQQHPERLGLKLAFDNEMAHLTYAGSDMFLMPSRYEPCGLGQLIALRYGAIPIVRNTGGLADTVVDYNQGLQKANGFSFNEYSPTAFSGAISRALNLFEDQPSWQQLMSSAMSCDYSWKASARKYLDLFYKLLAE